MSLNSKWVEFTVNALSLKFERTLWADVRENVRNWGGTTISRPLGFIPRGLFYINICMMIKNLIKPIIYREINVDES